MNPGNEPTYILSMAPLLPDHRTPILGGDD